jgi:uncharacterized cupin superfamily protein
MSSSTFSIIADRTVDPIEADLDGWTKVEGAPSMRTWIEYTADDGSMIAGWWEATPGTYRARYAAFEFVHLMEGSIVITPDGGESRRVGAGDAFVVESGFEGTWKIEERVLKHFCIRLK